MQLSESQASRCLLTCIRLDRKRVLGPIQLLKHCLQKDCCYRTCKSDSQYSDSKIWTVSPIIFPKLTKTVLTKPFPAGSFHVRSTNGLRVTPPISMKVGTRADNA